MEISASKIEELFDKYVERTFGSKFSFRPQQKEVMLDIANAFFDSSCNLYLLDASTGSGKSVIAMMVAGFLTEFKMKGYILASDLTLQSQYEKDLKYYDLRWGSIKGVDNYLCAVNSEKFSIGDCRLKNVSYEESEKLPCFGECGYLVSRKRAMRSPVAVLNYSYWLIQRNYVEGKMHERGKGVPFPARDFTFCDEAHKVPEIVQNHFSPRIDEKTFDKLDKLRAFLSRNNVCSTKRSLPKLRLVLNNLKRENDQDKLYFHLKELELELLDFVKAGNKLKEHTASKFPKDTVVPKGWRFYLGLADWVKDTHCKFEDYNHIISQVGVDKLIKNDQGEQIIFNCLDESYMMDRHFHSQAGFKLLMTATMGDPTTYLKNIGATNARYFKMDSHFDYTRSPIIFYPHHRMSMSQKEKNMPWLKAKVNEILHNHDENGIVHTGSYDNTVKIFESLDEENRKRVLVYQGTQEKNAALERFFSEKNLVLMGPSILEGLDLAAEKSRFQIFVKVPFPSLGDKFVAAKMNYQPEWYDWKTSCGILQGTGRSIRSDEDWAITYVLDGCLADLFKRAKKHFPTEFLKRIKLVDEDI